MYHLQIRLLNAANEILGWTEAEGTSRGDGQLWVEQDVLLAVERGGTAMSLSVHWTDVNVEVRTAAGGVVLPQQIVIVLKAGPVFRIGPAATGLPPITLYAPVSIGVPLGSMGARSTP